MIPGKRRWLLAVLLVFFSSPVAIFAQKTTWESTIEGARKALIEHRLADAAQLFLQASKEAEQFGPEDVRLAEGLDGLALVYIRQGKNAQAEPVQERAVEVYEKVYGLDHFETWLAKRSLAMLYRVQGKDAKIALSPPRTRPARQPVSRMPSRSVDTPAATPATV